MTHRSARQNAPLPQPPLHPTWDGAQPLPPPPPTGRRVLPTPSGTTLILIVSGAAVSNLAIQGRAASVAGWCSVLLAGAVILSNPERRTSTAVFTIALAATVSTNVVLRGSATKSLPCSRVRSNRSITLSAR